MKITRDAWFKNLDAFRSDHDLDLLSAGIREGWLDEHDEYGYTALLLCVYSGWQPGLEKLIAAGADLECRDFRTGCTALYHAAQNPQSQFLVPILLKAGADPDAPNYWGVTPRKWLPEAFSHVPLRERPHPEPRIQNAEHLADHYHPRFKIPKLPERVSLKPGQAVAVYVYGPKDIGKQDDVKVRIISRTGTGRATRYVAEVESPLDKVHLGADTKVVEFGPENVATVYVAKK